VPRVLETITKKSTLFTFIVAAALASRAVIVRQEGHLGQNNVSGGMMFVRSQKNAVPNSHIPSNIEWKIGTVIVPSLIFNSTTQFYVCGNTALKASYFFAVLLLLSPAVEHSAPVMVDKGKYIIFGVTCNRQTKRFRVDMDDAAKIMEFRERFDQSLGCLRVLRSLPREATLTEFTLCLQSGVSRVEPRALHAALVESLEQLASEMTIAEHQPSFTPYGAHRMAPADVGKPMLTVAEASDILLARKIGSKSLLGGSATLTSSAVAAAAAAAAADQKEGDSPKPEVVHEAIVSVPLRARDADVERPQTSFFLQHGPIIEDDDDD
jgi:hypothetical protein